MSRLTTEAGVKVRKVRLRTRNCERALQGDRFNPLDFFGGEGELFGLEVLLHMLLARGSGQREHADLHSKPKDDLCGTSA